MRAGRDEKVKIDGPEMVPRVERIVSHLNKNIKDMRRYGLFSYKTRLILLPVKNSLGMQPYNLP